MSKIWICSDWHFCHDKSFLYEPRGFKSTGEMNEAIIQHHNELVAPDDIVYHLGDEIMSDLDGGIRCLRRLNGQIHLIRGNHSTDTKLKATIESCPNVVDAGKWADMLKYHKYTFYLSHYPTLCANNDADKPLSRCVINLCGHTHTQDRFLDMDRGLIYHCEMDVNNCYPILLDDIIEDIKNLKK